MFESWVTELSEVSLAGRDRGGLCDAAASSARMRAALDAFDARVAAALEGLDDGGPGAAAMFRGAAKCSQREADRRARRAEALTALPTAADALASGALSAEHVDTLARAAEATSPAAVEASNLLTKARSRPADLLAKDARDWTRRQLSQHQLTQQHQRRRAARRLVIYDNDTGMTVVHAELDPVTGAQVRSAIDTATDRLFHTDGGRDHAHEVRTPQQRRADALAALLTNTTDETAAPTARPPAVRNQVLVIAHPDGTADIAGTGQPIPHTELQRLICTSDLYGLLFSGNGQPLWHGDRVRLATDDQWRSLIARDGGCVICNAHPNRCEAHHITFWHAATGRGPTDIDNLALVCKHHHHLIHDHGHQLHQLHDGTWILAPP